MGAPMSKMEQAVQQLHQIREEASEDSWIHRIYPTFKLLLTVFYIGMVTQIPMEKGEILFSMAIYLVFLFVAGGISLKLCVSRLWIALPFVAFMGLYPLFAERDVLLYFGRFPVTTGMMQFLILFLKGIYTVLAVYLLVVTTTVEKMCTSLAKCHVPSAILTIVLLIYRYLGLLLEEAERMQQAYQLRAPGQRGIARNTWGSFVGLLLLRAFERAERINESMRLRGFQGEFIYWEQIKLSWTDWLFFVTMCGMMVLLRWIPVFRLAGQMAESMIN